MSISRKISYNTVGAGLLVLALVPFAANADSGFYIGGSAGGGNIEAELGDTGLPGVPSSIDEDDTAFKVFGGYNFDLPSINLGVEAGYVDFGKPDVDTNLGELLFDLTGINLWGIAGFEAGPVDIFGKLGFIAWDVDASLLDESISGSGSDIGYGLGIGFNVGPVQIRGEYEVYDIEDADLSMLSLGVVYQFN
jgi:hypothetical protein